MQVQGTGRQQGLGLLGLVGCLPLGQLKPKAKFTFQAQIPFLCGDIPSLNEHW